MPVHTVLRTIATARIVLPKAIIRLAAGRHTFSETEQAMVRSAAQYPPDPDYLRRRCVLSDDSKTDHLVQAFMAGANAIFTGERMLTTPCSGWDEDTAMLSRWGLRALRSFEDQESLDGSSNASSSGAPESVESDGVNRVEERQRVA